MSCRPCPISESEPTASNQDSTMNLALRPAADGSLSPGAFVRSDAAKASRFCGGDLVLWRFTEALSMAEAGNDPYSAACADALRIAIQLRHDVTNSNVPEAVSLEEREPRRRCTPLPKWRLRRVVSFIEANLDAKITLQDLATVAGLSRMHFAAQFRAATMLRPHDYLLTKRIARAKEALKHSHFPVVEIALSVGFATQAHFTTVFKRFVGNTPYQWRSEHRSPLTKQAPSARRVNCARGSHQTDPNPAQAADAKPAPGQGAKGQQAKVESSIWS